MKKYITYGLYPTLLILTLSLFILTIQNNWDLKIVFTIMAGFRFVTLLSIEFIFPLKKEWKMTKKSFIRDLKWMSVGILIKGLTQLGIILIAIDLSYYNTGILANTSIATGAIITLVVFEFFQYWFHRISHTGKGKFRKWLWKIHVAHHLPEEVYLLMHPVAHPINLIVVQIIIQGSIILLGARPESIFIFNALMGLQGLVSHFNVNIKAGFLNYIFIGTESHRYHHSAKIEESQNYGAVISLWDIVFGTFYYNPKNAPDKLGVNNNEQYPDSSELFKVLGLPFKRNKK